MHKIKQLLDATKSPRGRGDGGTLGTSESQPIWPSLQGLRLKWRK